LTTISRAFQSDKLLIYQVPSKINATLLALTAFKSDPGIHMSTFLEKVESFKSITLANEGISFHSCSDYQTLVTKLKLDELLDNAKKNIKSRFKGFSEVPMSCLCAFDLGKLPTDYENYMATYGNQHIKDLVSHYKSELPALAADGGCVNEWPQLKVIH